MKKLLFLIFILALTFVYGQNEYYKLRFEAGLGSSFLGTGVRKIQVTGITTNSTPVFNATLSINLSRSMNLGLTATYQGFNADGQLDTLSFYLKAKKFNISAIGRYYYVNRKSFGLYSGLRFGVSFWYGSAGVDMQSAEPFINDNFGVLAPYIIKYLSKMQGEGAFSIESLQLVILGMNKSIYKNLGLFGELALGSPYYFNFGLTYGFNK